MFIQVIEGRIRDVDAMRERIATWERDVRPVGHLGSTHGAAPDGTWISVVRFESAYAARRNAERPEQDAWWRETSSLFDGPVRCEDSTEVDVVVPRSGAAGFVQVLRGRSPDKAALRALLTEIAPTAREGRPFLVGAVYAWHGDAFTNTVSFTSEADARAGEDAEPPPHMERWQELVADLRFFDLPEPILFGR